MGVSCGRTGLLVDRSSRLVCWSLLHERFPSRLLAKGTPRRPRKACTQLPLRTDQSGDNPFPQSGSRLETPSVVADPRLAARSPARRQRTEQSVRLATSRDVSTYPPSFLEEWLCIRQSRQDRRQHICDEGPFDSR